MTTTITEMSIPAPVSARDEQIAALRQELKAWEKAFATANDGRKAGRGDIKKDAVIGTYGHATTRH